MKKIASLLVSGAMLLGMATPSFAFWWPQPTEGTVINFADLHNRISANISTGFNTVDAFKGGTILSGAAESLGQMTNTANTNTIKCNCYDDLFVKNFADLHNNISASISTGFNKIDGGFFGAGTIGTGTAGTGGLITNVVNTNVFGN